MRPTRTSLDACLDAMNAEPDHPARIELEALRVLARSTRAVAESAVATCRERSDAHMHNAYNLDASKEASRCAHAVAFAISAEFGLILPDREEMSVHARYANNRDARPRKPRRPRD